MNFQNQHVVLTGDFAQGDKSFIATRIEELGGVVQGNVGKKTTLLIIGALGSRAWKTPLAGTKIIKAREMGIKIIHEDEMWN